MRNSTRLAIRSSTLTERLTSSITWPVRDQRLHRLRVVRGAAAPLEGGLVVVDLDAVQLDRAHQRRVRERHAALLPGEAEHQRVGVDRVAEQLHRERVGVEPPTWSGPAAAADRRLAVAGRELPVGVGDEGGRRRRVGVERRRRCGPRASTASVALLAATIGSQPITRSASAVPTLVEKIESARLAIWMWLQVAPPFCARPAASCVTMPLPSRCAAMPSSWPMVMTPVPPTPATTMPQGFSASGSDRLGRRAARRPGVGRSGALLLRALQLRRLRR